MQPVKQPWQSKTILLSALLGVFAIIHSLGYLASADVFLQAHQDAVLMGLSVIGMGLRVISKDKIVIE